MCVCVTHTNTSKFFFLSHWIIDRQKQHRYYIIIIISSLVFYQSKRFNSWRIYLLKRLTMKRSSKKCLFFTVHWTKRFFLLITSQNNKDDITVKWKYKPNRKNFDVNRRGATKKSGIECNDYSVHRDLNTPCLVQVEWVREKERFSSEQDVWTRSTKNNKCTRYR